MAETKFPKRRAFAMQKPRKTERTESPRRTERQRELLTVIAEKLSENDSLTILAVINKLLPDVQTNISLVDLISLASIGLQMDMNAIEQFRIPADGTFEAGMFGSVWCVKPNFKKNAQLLYDFVYNDDSTIPERNRENK